MKRKHKRNRRKHSMDNNTKDTLVNACVVIKRITLCTLSILAKSVKFLAEQVDNACSKNGRN